MAAISVTPRARTKSYRRSTCQSVSGTPSASACISGRSSAGTQVPPWGMLTTSGASPRVRV
ncbi:Uncharacterised protein [Bordetella pertussis]|nr:Uncharacterised protein [Bordetella pertussis]